MDRLGIGMEGKEVKGREEGRGYIWRPCWGHLYWDTQCRPFDIEQTKCGYSANVTKSLNNVTFI